ncbi:SGNH/GDSL hydrolase family protein [Amycolatopsis sp. H20-H5]|uniref:SGNH/GDSL hydrolase family protein n=1 Tax=Amycolatopsis sp. H20-H5 TaxID=3046309 RepID=UPI002DB99128|nr:SGNH/GDSL hydrolase family protein [Amycolatopsis sp. H20-H5]MEC3982508.1 SGNH/GDSL hydrolase family protein [Amycolatopsis sp. H20-H5]
MIGKVRVVAVAASAVFLFATASQASPQPTSTALPESAFPAGGWVGTWGASPAGPVPGTEGGYPNYSIRNVVHTSVGGSSARVRLSNQFGASPLVLGHASVAVGAKSGTADAVQGTVRELRFGGRSSVTIPAGAEVQSDAVALDVPEDGDLLVTTYTPTPSGPVTHHPLATQTSFFTRDGDHALDTSGAAYGERTSVWHYVSEVDVHGSGANGTVVALGDSITDGYASTPGVDHRWPDYLADRLKQLPRGLRHGVLNAGISANRLLLGFADGAGRPALTRFNDDVLTRTAPRTLIVLEGINDIQQNPHQTDPATIIAAYQQLVAKAHAEGIRVLGATITPFKGWQVYDATLEATRLAVNRFIRTGGLFDGVIDFDAALRDPHDPLRMRPEFDSGDHLHPGDAGYRAMAAAVNPALL